MAENLRKKSELRFNRQDLFWTLQIEIPGINLYIQEFHYHHQHTFPFATTAFQSGEKRTKQKPVERQNIRKHKIAERKETKKSYK